MRKLLAGAIFLIGGVGAASNATAQILNLRGSDTLEEVATQVINGCTFPAGTGFKYVGGGSGAGQAAMVSVPPTQNIAPMSRELNGTACTAAANELLIGLDGIAVVGASGAGGAPGRHKDSLETPVPVGTPGAVNDPADDCSDSIQGDKFVTLTEPACAAMGAGTCDPTPVGPTGQPIQYTFRDWKDVLAVIYGGQNHGAAAQLITIATADATHPIQRPAGRKERNPQRIDCGIGSDPPISPTPTTTTSGLLRNTLLNSWGTIFSDTNAAGGSCRSACCTRLKHAFRRGDLSGTTDTFVGLVGLVAIPGFTRWVGQGPVPQPNFPIIDQGTPGTPAGTTPSNATVNPFCNAGTQVMNKGDSDYLDLDPIRRIADSDIATNDFNRLVREQVGEGYANPTNPPIPGPVGGPQPPDQCPDNRVQPAIRLLHDWSASNRQNFGFDPSNPTVQTDEAAELGLRQGLGVVLTIEVPANYPDAVTAFWGAPAPIPANKPQSPFFWTDPAPVPCTNGVLGPNTAITGNAIMNPDKTTGLTNYPVDTTIVGTLGAPNYNCITRSAKPSSPPILDQRVYNLPVFSIPTAVAPIAPSKFLRDNYLNPNLALTAAQQARAVSAFYRLHTSQDTNFGDAPQDGGVLGIPPSTQSVILTTEVCKKFDSTAQIGCLVKANPCSIGFAGREAVDKWNPAIPLVPNSMAFRLGSKAALLDAFPPSTLRIEHLVDGSGEFPYGLARTLWVNAVTPASETANEGLLLTCFGKGGADPTLVNNAITSHNFVQVPAGVARDRGNPLGTTAGCPAVF